MSFDIFGYYIVVTPDHVEHVPKMQLSPKVREVLTPDMIKDHNDWLCEFFGTIPVIRNMIKDGQVIIIGERTAHMNPRTYESFLRWANYRG